MASISSMRGALVLLCWGLLASCSRCGKSGAGDKGELARRVPRQAAGVLLVPNLEALGEKLKTLEGLKISAFAAQLQGLPDGHAFADALAAQAGIDPRSKASLEAAGIDPQGGLAVVALSSSRAVSIVSLKDEAKFRARVSQLAKERLGATVEGKSGEISTFLRPGAQGLELGYLVKDGYAYLAAAQAVAELPALAVLPVQDSLAQEDVLTAAMKRLPPPHDVLAYVRSGSPLLNGSSLQGGLLVASLGTAALTVRADLFGTGAVQTVGLLEKAAGPALMGSLPADAFAVARFGGDLARAGPYWRQLVSERLAARLDAVGFNPQAELLENLKPGALVALSVAPDVKLGMGMPALDVRKTNPFQFVHLAGVAQVKDATKAKVTFDKLPSVGPALGAKLTAGTRRGQPVVETAYAQGEGVHFGLVGDKVVAASPLSRLEEALALAAAPGAGPLQEPMLRQALEGKGAAVVIDLRRLVEAVKALPPEAWGVGGFAIKATTVRWLEATDDLRAVTLGAEASGGSLQLELTLRLAPK